MASQQQTAELPNDTDAQRPPRDEAEEGWWLEMQGEAEHMVAPAFSDEDHRALELAASKQHENGPSASK